MNEKTNDKVENNNSMAQQENVGEKLDQEKDQENKIFAEESLENNKTSSEDNNSENNETAIEKGTPENDEISSLYKISATI